MPYVHELNPIAFVFMDTPVAWYWLFYPLGFFAVFFLARRQRKNRYLSSAHFIDHAIVSWISIILGGRLGYVLIYNFPLFYENPSLIPQFWLGGMSFHGALLAAIAGNIALSRYRKKRWKNSFFHFSDCICLFLPLALLLGRIGNFINGELWGRATQVPWGVIFPRSGDQVARHPSQLYEAFGEGALLFFILFQLRGRFERPGEITSLFLMGYGLIRFFIEFFREPDRQLGFFGIFSMGQLLCIVMAAFGWILLKSRRS